MDFSDVVRRRRMVRDFDTRALPDETVEKILGHAQRGPSSGFAQGFEFLVFQGTDQTRLFWEAAPWWDQPRWDGAKKAPLIIVPFGNESAYVAHYTAPERAAFGRQTGDDFPSPYWYIDTAFASMLILLSAVDSGLGGFYFSVGPTQEQVPLFCQALAIPPQYFPIGAMAIGFPGPAHSSQSPNIAARRRSPDEMVHRGSW